MKQFTSKEPNDTLPNSFCIFVPPTSQAVYKTAELKIHIYLVVTVINCVTHMTNPFLRPVLQLLLSECWVYQANSLFAVDQFCQKQEVNAVF